MDNPERGTKEKAFKNGVMMIVNRAIFLDVDGTLTGTISGETFKQHPRDVAVLPGVKEALEYYQNQSPKWVMVGISNQGGVAANFKSLQDAIAEFQYTLELLPQLQAVYFCPDFEGNWTLDKKKIVREQENRHHKLPQLFFAPEFHLLKPLKPKKIYAAFCLLGVDFDCFLTRGCLARWV